MIADSSHYAGPHDQHIVECSSEMPDGLVMYPSKNRDLRDLSGRKSELPQGRANPVRVCHLRLALFP